jgi:hypothetical protein
MRKNADKMGLAFQVAQRRHLVAGAVEWPEAPSSPCDGWG